MDNRSCFCEGLFIEIAGFLDPLDLAGVVGEAELVSGVVGFEEHVLFDDWGSSLVGLGLEDLAGVFDVLSGLDLVVFRVNLAVDFLFLHGTGVTLAVGTVGWWLVADLRL